MMIKDILDANENITAATAAENKLKAALPQCFDKDGNFCLEKLQELLKKDVMADENYELNFLGKSYGRLLQAMETDTVITPDEEHNSLPQNANSENLYITGDNLDALKHLLKSYENKIKCIYIDPPYNTGSDGFVYNDRFSFTKETLMQKLSVNEEKAERILELTKRGSASHSAWLTFIYPRLLLARDLLTDDGVIFISIDDNEQANLKLLCDDVFGEQNFVACLVYDKNRKNDAKYFSVGHEYMLVYFRNISIINENGIILRIEKEGINEVREKFEELCKKYKDDWNKINNELKKLYNSWDKDDPRRSLARFTKVDINGPYRDDGNINWPGGGGPHYEVLHPITKKPCKQPISGWRYPTIERLQEEINKGHIVFGKDETTVPRVRMNLFDMDKEVMRSVQFSYAQTASQNFNAIFDNKRIFENPKSVNDIKDIVKYVTCSNNSDTILDFFSGSATTAHAVMQLNSEDGGNRKFILVQLPEATKADSEACRAGYETIDQIGRERIKRAAAKIKEEHPDTAADLGFKHFRLNQLNSTQLSQIEIFSPELNLVGSDDLLQNFGMQTVLATWLNRDGYGLNPVVKAEKLADYTSYICGSHIYLLENGFDNKALMELCRKYEEDAAFATITNIVVFGYSFNYTELQALQDNVKKFSITRNSRINVEIRY